MRVPGLRAAGRHLSRLSGCGEEGCEGADDCLRTKMEKRPKKIKKKSKGRKPYLHNIADRGEARINIAVDI